MLSIRFQQIRPGLHWNTARFGSPIDVRSRRDVYQHHPFNALDPLEILDCEASGKNQDVGFCHLQNVNDIVRDSRWAV